MKGAKILTILLVLALAVSLSAETVMIKTLKGNVMVKSSETGDWQKAKMNMKLDDSAMIQVKGNGSIALITAKGRILSVDEERTLQVSELFQTASSGNSLSARLAALRAKLSKDSGDSTHTATAVAGVRGADVYEQRKDQAKRELYWEK